MQYLAAGSNSYASPPVSCGTSWTSNSSPKQQLCTHACSADSTLCALPPAALAAPACSLPSMLPALLLLRRLVPVRARRCWTVWMSHAASAWASTQHWLLQVSSVRWGTGSTQHWLWQRSSRIELRFSGWLRCLPVPSGRKNHNVLCSMVMQAPLHGALPVMLLPEQGVV